MNIQWCDNSPSTNKYIIELEGISYIYGKGTPFEKKALDGFSAKFEAGIITGIIGHTGSGKSTLVQLLNGLSKPTSGTVKVDGKDIWNNEFNLHNLRFKVGLVFQYPEYQLFEDTVRSDIAFGPKNMGLSHDEIEKRVNDAAGFVGLDSETLDKSPFELSGGQKRRAAIAGVMAMEPQVLILDEPAAGLDPKGRRDILGGVSEYKSATGSTVILVSHSMEDIAQYCDRILVVSNGKAEKYGSKEDIFKDPEFLYSKGLDVPQITKLVVRLRGMGVNVPSDIYTVSQAYNAITALYSKGEENA